MPLSQSEAVALGRELLDIRRTEKTRLDKIQEYLRDDPDRRLRGLPDGVPQEVHRLARVSRVNVLKYIVAARVQNMYVDGFQTPESPENTSAWRIWQRNQMDARQIGVHRAALSFGAAYMSVLPGNTVPVMRGHSPRKMTVAYGDDDTWPRAALEQLRGNRWRLIDDETVYWLRGDEDDTDTLAFEAAADEPHGATFGGEPVCPVVRYRDTDDLDDPIRGIVEPHIPLQDQINITTFGLQVAQHYGAFRQRYIIGWLAESEEQKLRASASKLWTFEDAPDDIKVGEFAQTELRGYIESREATLRHLATTSQSAVHELMGEFINLSAEALEAARASHYAAIGENRIMAGESHEQALNLATEMAGEEPDPSASVIWRDTRVRSLQDAAMGLGELVDRLGVPPRALWRRVPGVAQHELKQWEEQAEEGDAFADLERMLDRQAAGVGGQNG